MHKKTGSDSLNDSQNTNQEREKVKFTDLLINSLKPTNKRVIYWCEGLPGFGLRLSTKGKKTWVYLYRFDNRSRMLSIGRYPKISLSEARIAYTKAAYQVELGFDPAEKRVQENQIERNAETVKDLVDRYVEYSKVSGKKSWRREEVELCRDVVPAIGRMKVRDVKKRDLMPIFHEMIVKRNAPIGAKHLFAYVRRMFNVAIMWDIIDHNPCSNIKLGISSNRRQRHLLPNEIFQFWHRLEGANTSFVIKCALKFMLCTASRGIEVRLMEWSHLDENAWVWTIPHTKNSTMHRVYLHGHAKQLISSIKPYTGKSKYVFGSMRHEKLPENPPEDLKPMVNTSLSRAIGNNRDLFEMEEFTPHDLRRTAATLVTALGCPRQWAKLVLNHIESDVTGVYDQYAYDWEKNKAMEVLNYAVDRIVSCGDEEEMPSFLELREEIRSEGIYKREF